MPATEQVRALGGVEALDAIERALHGKLRAHRLAEPFIDRHGQDALQQSFAEYGRALARGGEISEPGAWIVKRAYLRAIDELRREERLEGGGDAAVDGEPRRGEFFSPTEAEAIGNVEVAKLRAAIAKLSAEQRQALGLYYFEERSTREAAQVLGCGQSTFRRRLDSALRVLRERFGVTMPEPGSDLAIEVGLAAWLSLFGARVVPTRGPIDQVLAAADAMRGVAEELLGRGRDAAARILVSGGGEGLGAAASGPLGKTVGGLCAGALTACALTGVVGPGVGSVDLLGGHDRAERTKFVHRHTFRPRSGASANKAEALGSERTGERPVSPSTRSVASGPSATANKRKREARQVKGQIDGLARAASESSAAPVPPTPAVSSSSTQETTAPSGGSSAASASAEETQAKQQFGAFK